MKVYYNENDAFAAAWLRELLKGKHIPDGCIDERSIKDVDARDLAGFEQVHLFAGIGGWAEALRLAGWDEPVWTGSCPCQPFSAAGKRRGVKDDRHLWPELYRLIRECRPATVFGEQVASKDGREWLAGIHADLEGMGYAFGAADLCAAGVGAPHIRQRLYWVGDSDAAGSQGRRERSDERADQRALGAAGDLGGVGDARDTECDWRSEEETRSARLEHAAKPSSNFWSQFDIIPCLDGKARRVGPGIFPLAHGVLNRVGTLRGAGNALVPQVAAEFIRAFMEAGK